MRLSLAGRRLFLALKCFAAAGVDSSRPAISSEWSCSTRPKCSSDL